MKSDEGDDDDDDVGLVAKNHKCVWRDACEYELRTFTLSMPNSPRHIYILFYIIFGGIVLKYGYKQLLLNAICFLGNISVIVMLIANTFMANNLY